MKKLFQVLLVISTFLLLTGCSNKNENLQPVSIGNLSFNYDANVWAHKVNKDQNAPLEFSDTNGDLITVNVSQESTYQNPMDMISFYETMVSTNKDYKVLKDPTKIKVNGTTWYEFGYSYNDGTTNRKVYQRFYGKYYNAASISFTSTAKNYDTGYADALKMMSAIKTKEVSNETNEAKAHKFLVGEWDLGNSGYLVLHDDGTYEWYKDKTKDKKNMHDGTYGCDVQNTAMSLKEGDGIYLVLFPEKLIVDGTKEESTTYKSDYIIAFGTKTTDGYQMVNMKTYALYTMKKQ